MPKLKKPGYLLTRVFLYTGCPCEGGDCTGCIFDGNTGQNTAAGIAASSSVINYSEKSYA